MGGSGVQRPLKFVKYLREFGWNPIVLCPEPGAYHVFDESLQQELDEMDIEIHRVKGNTPLHHAGNRKLKLPKWIEEVLRKISVFFWMPDNKTGWIKPGFKKAEELIKNKNIQVVFSTAAPYSNLILAAKLKQNANVKVVMDLRDEWLYSHLINFPTKWHKQKMEVLERKTLQKADFITVVNDGYKESFSKRFPGKEIETLPNGFDTRDFEEVNLSTNKHAPLKLKLLYSGLFYGKRTPDSFLKAFKEIEIESPELAKKVELQFQGGLGESSKKLIKRLELEAFVSDFGYLNHKEAVRNLTKADALWMMMGHLKEADKVTLGKMFEYFGAKKPILSLITSGKMEQMLKEYGAYYMANPNSVSEIKSALFQLINDFTSGNFPSPNLNYIDQFSRKKITKELASIFNVISS